MKKQNELFPLLGLFLITFAGLALEVAFTRLYSFMFENAYVYMIVSLAISGLGLGSFLFYLYEKKLSDNFGFFIPAAAIIFTVIPISGYFFPNVYIYLALSFLIFTVIGISSTALYKLLDVNISTIYFVDLAGGSIGSAASFYLLQGFGAVKTVQILFTIVIAAMWIIYSACFSRKRKFTYIYFGLAAVFSLNLFLNVESIIKLPNDSSKEMAAYLNEGDGKIIDTKWNAFGRVDLLDIKGNPAEKVMFIDGGAGTTMVNYSDKMPTTVKARASFASNPELTLALAGLNIGEKNDGLVIGSGGGVDIITLKALGVKNVTGIEINPSFIDMVKKYGKFNGDIYNNESQGIKIIQGEGRNFVRNTDKKYDTVVISLPLIKSIRNFSNYAMTENYIFTKDAFAEYRNILNDDGYFVVVAHNSLEILRLMMNAFAALAKEGIPAADAMKYMAVVEISHHKPILILKKTPFTKEGAAILHKAFHIIKNPQREVSFIPFIEQEQEILNHKNKTEFRYMFSNSLYKLSRNQLTLKDLEAHFSGYNISAISDDSPFFYNYEKGIPTELIVVLFISIIVLSSVLFFLKKNALEKSPDSFSRYFILIGFAFIMIEIGFIQKLGFFWGQETLSLALVLSLILLSSGAGSYISQYLSNTELKLKTVSILIPIFTTLFVLGGDSIFRIFEGGDYVTKFIITALFIIPEFMVMGFAFPTLLSHIKKENLRYVPWMIALNSIATIVGASFAIILAMKTGFGIMVLAGGMLYIYLIKYTPAFNKNNS